MVQSLIKLIAITLGALIVSFLIVFGVRSIGSQGTFAAPSHPWFKQSFWWIYKPSLEDLCSPEGLTAKIPTKDWIVTLPIRYVKEEWVIPCKGTPQSLAEFFKHSEHHEWLLNVLNHDTWGLEELATLVAPLQKDSRFALMSEAQKVSVFLRKKAPEWLFAADSASLLRLRLFESLWMETAIEFWPDFVILDFSAHDPYHLGTRGAAELARRKKRIIWDWNAQSSEVAPVDFQGVMTDRPSAAQQKFGSRL